MTHINEIEGIGPSHAEKLSAAEITTVEGLLEAGATPHGRKALEEKTGISHHLVLKLVNQADLFRVRGVERQYAELLRTAGVDTVLELAQRRGDHLHAKLVEINAKHHHVKELPSQEHVTKWIEEAQALPRVVEY